MQQPVAGCRWFGGVVECDEVRPRGIFVNQELDLKSIAWVVSKHAVNLVRPLTHALRGRVSTTTIRWRRYVGARARAGR